MDLEGQRRDTHMPGLFPHRETHLKNQPISFHMMPQASGFSGEHPNSFPDILSTTLAPPSGFLNVRQPHLLHGSHFTPQNELAALQMQQTPSNTYLPAVETSRALPSQVTSATLYPLPYTRNHFQENTLLGPHYGGHFLPQNESVQQAPSQTYLPATEINHGPLSSQVVSASTLRPLPYARNHFQEDVLRAPLPGSHFSQQDKLAGLPMQLTAPQTCVPATEINHLPRASQITSASTLGPVPYALNHFRQMQPMPSQTHLPESEINHGPLRSQVVSASTLRPLPHARNHLQQDIHQALPYGSHFSQQNKLAALPIQLTPSQTPLPITKINQPPLPSQIRSGSTVGPVPYAQKHLSASQLQPPALQLASPQTKQLPLPWIQLPNLLSMTELHGPINRPLAAGPPTAVRDYNMSIASAPVPPGCEPGDIELGRRLAICHVFPDTGDHMLRMMFRHNSRSLQREYSCLVICR
jgi:hypothetical protein